MAGWGRSGTDSPLAFTVARLEHVWCVFGVCVWLVLCRATPLRVYTSEPGSSGRAPQRSPANHGAASGSSAAPPTAVAPAVHGAVHGGAGPVVTYGGAWAQPSAAAASLVANMRPLRPVGLPSDYNNSFKSRTKAKVAHSTAEVPTMASLDAPADAPVPVSGPPATPNVDLHAL